MMKRVALRWSMLTFLLTLTLLLSACGAAATPAPVNEPSGQAPASETAQGESTAETTEAKPTTAAGSASEGETTLRWRTRPDNQAEIDVYKSVSEEIDQKMENVSLVYEPGGSEGSSYQDVLKTEIAAGTAPDVFWIPGTDVADFAKRGLILNLRPHAEKVEGFEDTDFYPGPMQHLTYNPETSKNDGQVLWGLPRDVSTFALYLNLDLIEEAGVEDPRELAREGKWDWDAFLKTAQAIDELGDEIKGYGQNAWWGPYGYWINAAGGNFFTEDRTGCALNSEEAIQGLEFESQIYNEHKVAVPYGQDAEPPFLAGTVGMFQNGRWATPGMRTGAKFNWDVVKLPDGPAGPSNWLFWGAYVVNAKTENPEAAFELIMALNQPEIQGKISELGANVPSRVSDEAIEQFLTFSPPENNQAFIQGLTENPQTEGPLWQGNWPEFDAIVGPEVSAVLTGEKSVEEYAKTICDQTAKAFAQ